MKFEQYEKKEMKEGDTVIVLRDTDFNKAGDVVTVVSEYIAGLVRIKCSDNSEVVTNKSNLMSIEPDSSLIPQVVVKLLTCLTPNQSDLILPFLDAECIMLTEDFNVNKPSELLTILYKAYKDEHDMTEVRKIRDNLYNRGL